MRGASAAQDKDPYFNYVTMLLHGDGTNGAQNNTFVDGSTNNLTLTKTGNLSQGSFSPYGSNWSNYFNGSSSLSCNVSGVSAGTSTFTFEAWVYLTTLASASTLYDTRVSNGVSTTGMSVGILATSGNIKFYDGGADNDLGGGITANAWTHVAIVRNSSNVITAYINGTATGTTVSSTRNFTDNYFWIASVPGPVAPYLNGYMSNLRWVVGTAVYTSNFTPSTTPLTAITNTKLLTCQSSRFIDNSSNNFAVTIYSAPSVQRFNPFGAATAYSTSVIGGSGYSGDGSSHYLYAPASSNFQYAGDFCIETYIYLTTSSTGAIFGTGGAGSLDQLYTIGSVSGIYYDGTTFAPFNVASQAKQYEWAHICLTRQSGVLRMIVNGILNGTKANSNTLGSNSLTPGIFTREPGSGDGITGYLSGLRVCNGSVPTSYQTSSTTAGAVIFTPPTAPITTTSQGATSAHVKLIVNFTNGAIFDNAMMQDFETVGNAQISTSVVKFGTGSMYFDGTGDYLSTPSAPSNQMGSGPFTIEAWIYPTTISGTHSIVGKYVGGSIPNSEYWVFITSTGRLAFVVDGSAGEYYIETDPGAIVVNTWTYITAIRSSGAMAIYINGAIASVVGFGANTLSVNTTPLNIGAYNSGLGTYFGYIDDLRITRGLARYSGGSFTVPARNAIKDKGPY